MLIKNLILLKTRLSRRLIRVNFLMVTRLTVIGATRVILKFIGRYNMTFLIVRLRRTTFIWRYCWGPGPVTTCRPTYWRKLSCWRLPVIIAVLGCVLRPNWALQPVIMLLPVMTSIRSGLLLGMELLLAMRFIHEFAVRGAGCGRTGDCMRQKGWRPGCRSWRVKRCRPVSGPGPG